MPTSGCIRSREVPGLSMRVVEQTFMQPVNESSAALERLRFGLLKDGPKLNGGRYVGLETAPITPWPHQTVVARRIIRFWPASYLLCDEVGLGKTIEAGLVIRSLWLAGWLQRVLVAVPASLTGQWQREMAEKFLLPFARALPGKPCRHLVVHPEETQQISPSLYSPPLVILSHALLSRRERRQELLEAAPFDLTLVDEAQAARRRNPTQGTTGHPRYGYLFRTLEKLVRPKTRSLLLLSATPMQLDPVEVWDLTRLIRRSGIFQWDPTLSRIYYECLGQLGRGEELSSTQWALFREVVLMVKRLDPFYWTLSKNAVLNGPDKRFMEAWLKSGSVPRVQHLNQWRRLLFMAAPLSRVMFRHTRALLEVYREKQKLGANLARRHILSMPRIVFTEPEWTVHEALDAYCRELAGHLSQSKANRGSKQAGIGFYSNFLRLRFASSLWALRMTLLRRLWRVRASIFDTRCPPGQEWETLSLDELLSEGEEDGAVVNQLLKGRTLADLIWEERALQKILPFLEDSSIRFSKMEVLVRVLTEGMGTGAGRMRQVVIFTRFYDTLVAIVEQLRQVHPGFCLGTCSGRGGGYVDAATDCMVTTSREEVKRRFLRREIDILVCTDVAAEGFNLQTADLLVNFDLPWNPMKVEQRIGRIDRIGQENEHVYVLNLCYLNSAEEIVYGRLLERLAEIHTVVGTQQVSMLPVRREEFQALAEGTLSSAAVEELAKERLQNAREVTAAMEIPPEDLFAMYEGTAGGTGSASEAPVDLEAIWETLAGSPTLQSLGCRVLDVDKRLMRLQNIPGIPDGTLATTSRQTFERGLQHTRVQLHFLTYGDPAFQAVLDLMAIRELPPGIWRITTAGSKKGPEQVGYVAAAWDAADKPVYHLITAFAETRTLRLRPTAEVPSELLAQFQRHLKRQAAKELQTVRSVRRMEKISAGLAESQLLLNLVSAWALLLERRKIGLGARSFGEEMIAIQSAYKGREKLRIKDIPQEFIVPLQRSPFVRGCSGVAGDIEIVLTPELLRTALETAMRVANGMRVKHSQLQTRTVMGRLLRLAREQLQGASPTP